MKEYKFISKKKKDKINVFDNTHKITDMQKTYAFRSEMFSNRSLILEGCQGVDDYREDYIKLRVKKGYVVLTGNDLNIILFEDKTIRIEGVVLTVAFCV